LARDAAGAASRGALAMRDANVSDFAAPGCDLAFTANSYRSYRHRAWEFDYRF
jgi:hypothetical protein